VGVSGCFDWSGEVILWEDGAYWTGYLPMGPARAVDESKSMKKMKDRILEAGCFSLFSLVLLIMARIKKPKVNRYPRIITERKWKKKGKEKKEILKGKYSQRTSNGCRMKM
jgi:hypothetical protein